MGLFIWWGTLLGALLGFAHAAQIVLSRRASKFDSGAKTLWTALWVWALWTLFGAYVLALWIIGLVLMSLSRVFSRREAPR
jgi:Na+/proline symporter